MKGEVLRSLRFWWRLHSARRVLVGYHGATYIMAGFGPNGLVFFWRQGDDKLSKVDPDDPVYSFLGVID